MRDIHQILKSYWGYDQFRPMQEDIIRSVLLKKDTLAIMPTGGGKSLCYQVPAMAMDGLCLVISPLIALMKDQVENLRKKKITAFAIYSGMKRKEVINTLQVASESNCKFLYVSPERLQTDLFQEYLPGLGISLVAVDEAHCISQWGYDFRPPYLQIATLREELPGIPFLALTASATPDVQLDIAEKLSFQNHNIFRQSFERQNLSYSVFDVDSRINKVLEILNKIPGTAIIYCKSRKRTKEISDILSLQNISADYYHAGLTQDERNRKQEGWINNNIRVIVCTNAFGMGIDKPDVRVVIHIDTPDCLENYYQEAGRAGRDGKTSYSVLLSDSNELEELEGMSELRFPSLATMREVYQAVVNYLQIPVDTGAGQYYEFDLTDFSRKFKLNSFTTIYSLKALEQEGWLHFNEQIFLPSTVEFTINKDRLYAFEKDYPLLEPLIKALLRSYEGIFDNPCFVSEIVIAQLLKNDSIEVKDQLKRLHQHGIIEYRPQTDSPQIYFSQKRIRAEDISVDRKAFDLRKTKFEQRVRQMIRYVQDDKTCRSKIIGNYFGDIEIKDCGVCDNCLRTKRSTLSDSDIQNISQKIVGIVNTENLTPKELVSRLSNFQMEKCWKVLDLMQAENQLQVDKNGIVRSR